MFYYNGYKKGDTIFLNGNRLTLKSINPKIYGTKHNQYIYVDTEEKGTIAIPIW